MNQDAALANAMLGVLIGRRLTLLSVTVGQANLDFDGGHYITLECGIAVDGQGAERPQDLAGVALLLPLLNGEVAEATVRDDGSLSLTVADRSLTCRPHEQFEAWNFTAPGGSLVVCTPGGGLAIWS